MKEESNDIKSTEVRLKLKPLLQRVYETGDPINILLDGKVVACLTRDKPHTTIPPAKIRVTDAKNGWSELLNYVFIMGARYYFQVRFDEDEPVRRIYLIRPKDVRNRFDADWKEHREKHRATAASPDNIQEHVEELQETFQEGMDEIKKLFTQLDRKINVAFATLTRPNNDPRATPEAGHIPRSSASDLDHYEVD